MTGGGKSFSLLSFSPVVPFAQEFFFFSDPISYCCDNSDYGLTQCFGAPAVSALRAAMLASGSAYTFPIQRSVWWLNWRRDKKLLFLTVKKNNHKISAPTFNKNFWKSCWKPTEDVGCTDTTVLNEQQDLLYLDCKQMGCNIFFIFCSIYLPCFFPLIPGISAKVFASYGSVRNYHPLNGGNKALLDERMNF